jgi:hypothetical protein
MKIGIDLDNTIISYDEAFLSVAKKEGMIDERFEGSKNDVKQLIQENYGEIDWQMLQGLVYGKYIHEAKIFKGFKRFIWRCHFQGVSVQVISHKTEYGHQDKERISLRKAAIDFLDKNKLINDSYGKMFKNIDFASTRDEKIEKINEQSFDWFIDDLHEVIFHKNIDDSINKILFSGFMNFKKERVVNLSHWDQIEKKILGPFSEKEIMQITLDNLNKKALSSIWIGGRGNSGIYKVTLPDKKHIALKIYSYKRKHSNLYAEFEGSKKIIEGKINNLPTPINANIDFNLAYFEWVDGEHILKSNTIHLDKAMSFLSKLHLLREKDSFIDFPRASAACFSGRDIELQLKQRINNLFEAKDHSEELREYLTNELEPFIKIAIDWSKDNWGKLADFDRELSKNNLTLSPSDFGFHNVLIKDDDELVFHDFEYFGWDDPVKLIVDFSLHPAMNLNQETIVKWFDGTVKIYGRNIIPRLKAAWPLYALCWTLIYLNEFRDDVWERRVFANPDKIKAREIILKQQLNSSKALLTKIRNNYNDNKIIGNL